MNKPTLDELPRILHSVVLGGALIYLLWPLIPGVQVGREQTIVFIAAALTGTVALRTFARMRVARALPQERCLIVGSGTVARQLAAKLRSYGEYGVELVGFVDGTGRDGAEEDPEVLGDVSELDRICRALCVDRVVIAFSAVSHEELINVVDTAARLQLQVSIVPRLFEGVSQVVEIDNVHGMTLHGLRGLTRTRSSLRLKRAIDILIAGTGLLALSPVMIAAAIVVKASSPGPVFFRQRRIGRSDEAFRMFKFRTMYQGADALKTELLHLNEASGPMFKIAADPRVTRVGRWLRRTSIDELPQLLNVLRGDMSLVGPRPLVPDEDGHVIGWHRARLDLTPGLTGPWQVLGRNAIPFAEMVRIDYLYVAEWSLWNDVKLLIRTAPLVLRGNGR
jgi:exopolysaccharide biosynthesis polyprenyl glycosylphosphotransferase